MFLILRTLGLEIEDVGYEDDNLRTLGLEIEDVRYEDDNLRILSRHKRTFPLTGYLAFTFLLINTGNSLILINI